MRLSGADREYILHQLATRSERQGDCLVWTGGVDKDGYGQVGYRGANLKVHRVAYIARHGEPPPETPFVLHTCDNPPCWADEHLYAGTQAQNVADMIERRRHHYLARETCKNDHPWEPGTTYVRPSGSRVCLVCRRECDKRRRAA